MADYSTVSQRTSIANKSIASLIRYFVLIPLLLPQGLGSIIPGYKTVTTLWAILALYFVLLDITFRVCHGELSLNIPAGIIIYFLMAISVTALSSKGVASGLQELLFFPAISVYLLSLSEDELREYAVACARVLTVLFLLQLLVPSSLFAGRLHMTMLGHVQVFSQYGLLSITLACFLYLKKWVTPSFAFLFLALSIACMVTVDADSAHYALFVFVVVLFLLKICPILLKLDLRIVVIFFIAFSMLVVILTIHRQSPLMGTDLDWTFSGRLFVWESADALFRHSPLFGYGVENSVITTFWSAGMSYAHNQVMQCLIDGGIALLLAMVWMLCSIAGQVNMILDASFRKVAISALCALLFVMVFDSFTPYSYVFIMLAFITREGMLSRKGRK